MYCTNTMKIEMNNNIKAIKAMDIIKNLIMENKDAYNKNYRKDASQMLLDALAIDNNCIIISDELFGEFFPEDSKMFTDIVNALANQLKSEFEAKICNTSDYSEMWIKAFCDCADGHILRSEEIASWSNEMIIEMFTIIYLS